MKTIFYLVLSKEKKLYYVDDEEYGLWICSEGFYKLFPDTKGCDYVWVEIALDSIPKDGKKWVRFEYCPRTYMMFYEDAPMYLSENLMRYCFGKCPLSTKRRKVYVRVLRQGKGDD